MVHTPGVSAIGLSVIPNQAKDYFIPMHSSTIDRWTVTGCLGLRTWIQTSKNSSTSLRGWGNMASGELGCPHELHKSRNSQLCYGILKLCTYCSSQWSVSLVCGCWEYFGELKMCALPMAQCTNLGINAPQGCSIYFYLFYSSLLMIYSL